MAPTAQTYLSETFWIWVRRMVEQHFEKLLLLSMLSYWGYTIHHVAHSPGAEQNGLLAWAREQTTGVQGALLGMLTGFGAASRMYGRGTLPTGTSVVVGGEGGERRTTTVSAPTEQGEVRVETKEDKK